MTLDAVCGAATDALVYDTFNAAAAAHDAWTAGTSAAAMPGEEGDGEKVQGGRRKRRRRARSCRNREEAESQRMTHIAVERNRRRQMNEYLAVLRSLMPDSHAHRGDQASIVGGAIDFVKELEQQLQSLEAQKRALLSSQQQRKPPIRDAIPTTPSTAVTATAAATTSGGGTGAGEEPSSPPAHEEDAGAPFARFFTYPQYVWRQRRPREDYRPTEAEPEEKRGGGTAAADIEVSLVETHASVRVMAPRRPGQLLRMVAGMEALRLAVLHLNVTALDSLALYSLSLKVEEGCGLATADDVAAAVHHVICIIHGEATSQQRMLTGRQPELLS